MPSGVCDVMPDVLLSVVTTSGMVVPCVLMTSEIVVP